MEVDEEISGSTNAESEEESIQAESTDVPLTYPVDLRSMTICTQHWFVAFVDVYISVGQQKQGWDDSIRNIFPVPAQLHRFADTPVGGIEACLSLLAHALHSAATSNDVPPVPPYQT